MKANEAIAKTKWSIDQSHSEISFKVRHLMISHVKGGFKTFDASIYTIGKDFRTAEVDLWIDASSIFTGDEKRDEHLKSPDFFDVENFKQITFTSGNIEKSDELGNHEVWGELTMMGYTQNIKLNLELGGLVNDPWGKERAGFTVTGIINRSDWGLTWNSPIESGGFMVSDQITISCDIELINIGQYDLKMQLESATNK